MQCMTENRGLPSDIFWKLSLLQKSINTKMRWMNCRVSVVDSDTYNKKIFQLIDK